MSARTRLEGAGIPVMTILPVITGLLGNYKTRQPGRSFKACDDENIYPFLGKGGIR